MQTVSVKKLNLTAIEKTEYKKGKVQQEGKCKELAGIWDEALKKQG